MFSLWLFCFSDLAEPRRETAGKKSAGSTKKYKGKDKRKQQPVTDEEDEDGSDQVEDSSASD